MNLAGSMATGLMMLFALRYHFYSKKEAQNLYIVLIASSFLLWNVSEFSKTFGRVDLQFIFFMSFLALASITPVLHVSKSLNLEKLYQLEWALLLVFGISMILIHFLSLNIQEWGAFFFTANSILTISYLAREHLKTRSFSRRSKITLHVIYYTTFAAFEISSVWVEVLSASAGSYLLSANSLALPIYLYVLLSIHYGYKTLTSTGFFKNILYGAFISLVVSAFFVIGYYVNSYFTNRIGIIQSFFVSFALIFFAFFAFSAYLKKFDRILEKVVKSGAYYYRESMMNFVRQILEIDSLEELEPIVVGYCRKILNVKEVEIFFREQGEIYRSLNTSIKIDPKINYSLLSSKMVDLYTIPHKPSHFKGKELLVWLKNVDKVEGFLLLGHKQFGKYTRLDMEILELISNQITFFMSRLRSIKRVRKAERSMFFQERMVSLGKLAFGVAHEIRNPLNVISTSLQILNEDTSSTEKLKSYIQEEIERINNILENFLDFARQKSPSIEEGDVRELIDKTVLLLSENALKKSVKITPNVPKTPVMANFDKNMLMEILLNLGTNALDAVEKGGNIEFSLTFNKNLFTIEVSDDGKAIDPSNIDHIFEPFYTTKPNGTGLGLAIVYNYVHKMGGTVRVKSDKAETKFTVTLPLFPVKREQKFTPFNLP